MQLSPCSAAASYRIIGNIMSSLNKTIDTFLGIKPGHASDMTLSHDNLRGGDLVLGDVAGHKFRGNQYTDGGDPDKASDKAIDATNDAYDKNTPEAHKTAADLNRRAASVINEALDDFPAAPKVPYPASRYEDEGYEPLEKWQENKREYQNKVKGHLEEAANHDAEATKLASAVTVPAGKIPSHGYQAGVPYAGHLPAGDYVEHNPAGGSATRSQNNQVLVTPKGQSPSVHEHSQYYVNKAAWEQHKAGK